MKTILPVLCSLICTLFCKAQTSAPNISADSNPLGQTTVITFTVLSMDTVSMSVYNAAGQIVLTPRTDEALQAGVYQNTLDLSGSPNGIYIVNVTFRHGSRLALKLIKEGTVGIPLVNGPAAVRSFPNPVKDILHLESIDPGTTITLYTVSGQEVYNVNSLAAKQELDLSALPAGNYFLKVRDNNGLKTIKILKE